VEALLTAIVLWLLINFLLPANLNHPSIKFASAAEMAEMIALTNKSSSGSARILASSSRTPPSRASRQGLGQGPLSVTVSARYSCSS
jgi:hypothetical protein